LVATLLAALAPELTLKSAAKLLKIIARKSKKFCVVPTWFSSLQVKAAALEQVALQSLPRLLATWVH
jgi:hypothetical protein